MHPPPEQPMLLSAFALSFSFRNISIGFDSEPFEWESEVGCCACVLQSIYFEKNGAFLCIGISFNFLHLWTSVHPIGIALKSHFEDIERTSADMWDTTRCLMPALAQMDWSRCETFFIMIWATWHCSFVDLWWKACPYRRKRTILQDNYTRGAMHKRRHEVLWVWIPIPLSDTTANRQSTNTKLNTSPSSRVKMYETSLLSNSIFVDWKRKGRFYRTC